MIVVTANRLLDGEVVWLGEHSDWVEDLSRAKLLEDREDVAAAMRFAQRSVADRDVVEPYEMNVVLCDGCLRPQRLRERIRAAGPTVLPGLGKQARVASN